MAKKDKDALYTDFLADLKSVVGDDKWTAVEEGLVKNEKASAKLKDSVLARSEFSRAMDELDTARKEFQQFQATEKQKIDGWQKWYGETSQDFATASDQLRQYKETYGDLDDRSQRREAAKVGLTPEAFEKRLNEEIQKHDVAALRFVDDLTDVKIEHRDRFKEKLDTDAVYKLAGEQGIPLKVAYNLFIADRVEDQRKTQYTEDIKKAREEGANEALAKHNLPVMSSHSDIVHTLDAQNPLTNPRERVSAAVKDFVERSNRQ